jgi:hypothetical protein
MMHGPAGRDKRKLGSGVIRARYLLVKNPLGGYGEAGIRAGADIPEALPHIEIDVAGQGGARRRGPSPASAKRLVVSLMGILGRTPNPQGFISELEVRTDPLPDIDPDPDFWPRVVLDLSDRVYIRARTSNEALRFVTALIHGLKLGAFEKDYTGWTNSEIVAGSPHSLSLVYDKFVVQRLAGKIACGLMFLQFGPTVRTHEPFRRVRGFVLGSPGDRTASPVTQVCDAGTETPWKGNHVAFICTHDDRTLAVVSIYGDCQLVNFGANSGLFLPDETQLAMCMWNGTQARMVPASTVPGVATELKSRAASFFTPSQKY